MKTSHKALIGVGVVAVLGVGVAFAGPPLYREFFAAPPAAKPELSASSDILDQGNTTPTDEVIDPLTLAGTWKVASGSEAGYRVDEVLNGTNVTVTGRTSEVTGSFTISADGLTLDHADLSVDVASIATDNNSRDHYFRDQALHASEHPTATFTLTAPVTLAQAPRSGEVVEAKALGTLTIAGVSNEVTFSVQVKSSGETAEIAGSIPVTFADYGVEAPNLGFVSVEPTGAVEFALTATKA